jgi:hypothetical protein
MVIASVTYFGKNPPGHKRVGLKNSICSKNNELSFSLLAGKFFDPRIESEELPEERSPSRRFSMAEKLLTI